MLMPATPAERRSSGRILVEPGPIAGTVTAPPSKSVTHRGIFLATLAGGGTVIDPLESADTRASMDAVRALGATLDRGGDRLDIAVDELSAGHIDARNAGTTLRFATAVAALCPGTSRLDGDASLRQRPLAPLVGALRDLGAEVTQDSPEFDIPCSVRGPIAPGDTTIDTTTSSQFASALALVGGALDGPLSIELRGPLVSAPYLDLTLQMLTDAGVDCDRTAERLRIDGTLEPGLTVTVSGDYSSAAFLLAAGSITGGEVTVENLPADTGQGDERVLDILEAFGLEVSRRSDAVTVSGRPTTGISRDFGDTPDLVPPMAAIAATIDEPSTFSGIGHLRHKESDRLRALADGLTSLGVDVSVANDSLSITGGNVAGGTVDSYGDHRIQMAFAILGLGATEPVVIRGDPALCAISYPDFLEDLRSLGATVRTDG